MRRLYLLLVIALALGLSPVAFAQEAGVNVDLEEVDGSGISGSATLDIFEGQTRVLIELEGEALEEDAGVEYSAILHDGTCDDLGDVFAELNPVSFSEGAGLFVSVTLLDATIEDILSEQRSINVSFVGAGVTDIACGNLPTGDDNQNGDGNVPDEGPDTGAGGSAHSGSTVPGPGLLLVGAMLAAGAATITRARSV